MHQPTTEKAKTTEKTKATVTEEKEEELDDLVDSDEFAKQLAAGMEDLMGQFEKEGELKDTFEKVWASLDNTPEKNREASKASPQSFQEAIGKTMNKLKDSSKEIDVRNLVGMWEEEKINH